MTERIVTRRRRLPSARGPGKATIAASGSRHEASLRNARLYGIRTCGRRHTRPSSMFDSATTLEVPRGRRGGEDPRRGRAAVHPPAGHHTGDREAREASRCTSCSSACRAGSVDPARRRGGGARTRPAARDRIGDEKIEAAVSGRARRFRITRHPCRRSASGARPIPRGVARRHWRCARRRSPRACGSWRTGRATCIAAAPTPAGRFRRSCAASVSSSSPPASWPATAIRC